MDKGRRSEFILELHPDLVLKLNMKMPLVVTSNKDCEKLKKHRDCIYRSECRWVNNKCIMWNPNMTLDNTDMTTTRKL
jgi:hypothetical protein